MQQAKHFNNTEECWFWYMSLVDANQQYQLMPTNAGTFDPQYIFNLLNKLYRAYKLDIDELRVLRYYGSRGSPPNPFKKHEQYASTLWRNAINTIGAVLIAEGIVDIKPSNITAVNFKKKRG